MRHFLLIALLTVTGCFDELEADEALGQDEYQALTKNALTKNALTKNALTKNALTKNGLTKLKLTTAGLQAPFTSGGVTYSKTHLLHPWKVLQTDSLSRTTFKYLYECAMPAGKSVTLSYVNSFGQTVNYPVNGSLGFAPEWETGTCGTTCQRWVSACMISRLNTAGVSVELSVRAEHPAIISSITWDELVDYQVREASFYGNVFVEPMQMYACIDSGEVLNDILLPGRVCGDNYNAGEDCPVTMVGYCQRPESAPDWLELATAACVDAPADIWYTSCHAGSVIYSQVVTVYLQQ